MPRANETIRVLCVDDNRLVGDAIGVRFSRTAGMEWLGQLMSADELVERVVSLEPDVVLLDFDMPGMHPFEAVESVGKLAPDVRVVMLSGYIQKDIVERALAAGVWGYLSKEEPTARLIEAVREVSEGTLVMSPDVMGVLDGA